MSAVILEQNEFAQYVEAIKRRTRPALLVGGAVLLVATLVALLIPSTYRSSATILIEQQEIPVDLVRSTVTSYADQRIQVISQRVMTTTNLNEIMEKYDLYGAERRTDPREVVLSEMRDDISMNMINADVVDPRSGKPAEAVIAFSLSFDSRSPTEAQQVTNELVTLFLNENLRTRTELAQQTSAFLGEEAGKLRGRVEELEQRLAAFKEQNVDVLPELMNLNLDLRARAENEIARLEQQISALRERRIYLDAQLAQISPFDAIYSETGQRLLGPGDRLKQLELELVNLTARYGTNHPDVVRAQREIDALRAETGATGDNSTLLAELERTRTSLAAARETYSSDHPDVKALERKLASLQQQSSTASTSRSTASAADTNNPAYIQIKARTEAANAEYAAAQGKLAEQQASLNDLNARLARSPQVESNYRALMRDYEAALSKYQEFSAKQMEAEVSESLETERKGERLTLIEPPLLPEEPSSPNRLAIFLIGIILAMGSSVGTVALSEALDQTVHGRSGLVSLLGAPPLGMIPHIGSAADAKANARSNKRMLQIGIPIAVIAFLILVHFTYRPLDVLFFVILRKLGL